MNAHTSGATPSAMRKLAVLFAVLALLVPAAAATTIYVEDPFVNGFGSWTDTFSGTPQAGAPPNWGVLLNFDQQLSESSDGRAGDGATNAGDYTPFLMVNTADVTPSSYDLAATLATVDNDGLGVVFGYQDNDNYFRVGFREQSSGSLGFSVGTSVQKVVGGVITQLAWDNTATPPIDGTPFNVNVFVNGPRGNDWAVVVNNTLVLSGNDADLQPGNYGVLSWAQKQVGSAAPQIGSLVDSISITSLTLNQTANFAGAIAMAWRPLLMTNADGAQGGQGEDLGNFRQDFRNGTIQDDSNGYEWATATAPNIDFIGPGVVIDDPDSTGWSNYEMKVRMQNGDNDGIGLLVRVADDDSFYRVNFAVQDMDAAGERPPKGMSIQKNDNGVWSELFRDDQDSPLFLFTEDVPFDVTVTVFDSRIEVQVIDDPDGAANVINYGPIIDGSSPILAGTVGFANFASGDAGNGVIYSRYGGDGQVLLREVIPEPSTFVLFGLLSVCSLALRRRK